MTLDVRGSLKNTKLSTNKFAIFEELLSNAIDSFLIRKHIEPNLAHLKVDFQIAFEAVDLLDDDLNVDVICKDNGCGLGAEQTSAFLTKDTSYKDDLAVTGIGKCKGSGRIQFFHYFSDVRIYSSFRDAVGVHRRELKYNETQKVINSEHFKLFEKEGGELGTSIQLKNLKSTIKEKLFHGEDLLALWSSKNLKNQMLVAFLQRFVSLREKLGEFQVSFSSSYKGHEEVEILKKEDLPEVSSVRDVKVQEANPQTGETLETFENLTLSHYKLDAERYELPKNAIALCAKSSPVLDITQRYLRNKTVENNPIHGSYHIVMIEGDLLDHAVNEQRDGFELPEDLQGDDLFSAHAGQRVSLAAIFEAVDHVISELVAPPDWKKEDVVESLVGRFGVSESMLAETGTRIVHGDTAQAVVERVLKKYQERIIDETSAIMDLKEEIVNSNPDSLEFREKVNELAWQYASTLKEIDKTNLSQLVVRRAAILEVLSLACNKELDVQINNPEQRRKDEALIHSIFFPMRKDSEEVTEHDIWLLSEEYHYYDYIASDMPLSKIKWEDDTNLFDAAIDDEFKEILSRRESDNAAKRPDIALFNKEGAAIIVEFKAPDVSMDEHEGDLIEYAHLLAAKSGGRLKKFYGYLIGDKLNPIRLGGWTRFPTGKGFFRTIPITDPENQRQLGELYSEMLFYDDVITRADKRLSVYRDKLNIEI